MAGTGADLRDLLMRELNIPRTSKWFEVRFGVGDPISVRCEFLPEEQPEPDHDAEDPEDARTPAPDYGGLNG